MTKINSYPNEIKAEIKEYLKDHSYKEASIKFNIPASTIHCWFRQKKINENKSLILEYYKTHSTEETCKKFNIKPKTLYNSAYKAGFKKSDFLSPLELRKTESEKPIFKLETDSSNPSKEEIVEFYKTNTGIATCEKYNVSAITLQKYCKQLGYKKYQSHVSAQAPKYEAIDLSEESGTKKKMAVIISEDTNALIDVLKGIF